MSDMPLDIIYNRDCLEGLPLLPDASVDLLVTDPPFAIDFRAQRANYHRTGSRVIEGYDDVRQSDYLAFTRRWLAEAARLLKPAGAAFVFSGWNNLKDILVAADELGLVTVNHIIWKYQFGVVTKRRFVTSHYHCLYFCKDDRQRKFFPYARFPKDGRGPTGRSLHYADKEDVWTIKREYWHGDRKTPTKLPAEVLRKILLYSSEPGDLVLDPFIGSGQVAVVAKALGRHYLGFELVKEYYDFAAERLASGRYRLPAEGQRPRQRRDAPGPVIELA